MGVDSVKRAGLERGQPTGGVAALVALASLVVGGAYYAYLVVEPFPPALARIGPFVWLGVALVGLVLGVRAIHADAGRALGIASVLASLPSVALATIFALAALMGG